MKKDEISREIAEVRSRLTTGWDTVIFDVRWRLQCLGDAMTNVESEEIFRHVPVSAIAALQTMCKGLVVDLVKLGEPYRTRASELVRDRIAVSDAVQWFHGAKFTFGEVVAHALTFNSIADVHSVTEKLLGVELKGMLARAISPTDLRNNSHSEPLIKDVEALYRDVEETFRTRHILAHEAASRFELRRTDASRMLNAVMGFVDGLDAVLWSTAYSDFPLTTVEMNAKAGADLRDANKRLTAVVARTRTLAEESGTLDPAWFDANQSGWLALKEDWFDNSYRKLQGTMWPSVGALQEKEVIEARIEQLREWNAWQLGDQSELADHPTYRESPVESVQRTNRG